MIDKFSGHTDHSKLIVCHAGPTQEQFRRSSATLFSFSLFGPVAQDGRTYWVWLGTGRITLFQIRNWFDLEFWGIPTNTTHCSCNMNELVSSSIICWSYAFYLVFAEYSFMDSTLFFACQSASIFQSVAACVQMDHKLSYARHSEIHLGSKFDYPIN